MNQSYLQSKLPPRIDRLGELAYNLWWSWHPLARQLFRILDYRLWKINVHNPVKLLRQVSPDRLQAVANDVMFLSLYDKVMAEFDAYISAHNTWAAKENPPLRGGPIAFFSPEFALHTSLPIYAGGLGVLTGDFYKEASDLGLPLVGVGFMYPQGYFRQHITVDGWQREIYEYLDFKDLPIQPVLSPQNTQMMIQLPLADRTLYIAIWQVKVGGVDLYLLDTNVEENSLEDRQHTSRLYIADPEMRLVQEIILGIGGVRALRELGINPIHWHANEGHTAFMMVERVREEVAKGKPFNQAIEEVRGTTTFTTHTPVPAAHDVFPVFLIEKHFKDYWHPFEVSWEVFLRLGEGLRSGAFDMTALALRLAGRRNAVSQIHARTARKMWHCLWTDIKREEDVPILAITNGVHIPTWIARELIPLYEEYLGKDWLERQDEEKSWQGILNIPDEELWAVHQLLKRKLISVIVDRAQQCWAKGGDAREVVAAGALLNPEVLTIAFCRRFTEYKRPTLIFQDLERLKRIVTDRLRPVQIIFAGKSHPADEAGKRLIREVYLHALDRQFLGRIAFIEDYDIHLAHFLVQGADVWLNTPRRRQEACGSSGMKASINGVLHLSVLDGWWVEGYTGRNGWAIGKGVISEEEQDQIDAQSLYCLLEEEIAPLYYQRDLSGIPREWVRMMKEAIRTVAPRFCARRMLKEYSRRMYLEAILASR